MQNPTSTTFEATCPCQCGTLVMVTDEGFSTTTVEAAACESGKAQGIVSTTWRKSSFAIVSDRVVRHRDGLVTLVSR